MKTTNKVLSVLLAAILLAYMAGVPVHAAESAIAIKFQRTTDMELPVGYYIVREAVTTPPGMAVAYLSSDPTVATVNSSGKVVGVKPGKAVITASAGSLAASYNVAVVPSPTVVPPSASVFDGYNVTILDKTTPAVDARGRINDRNVMCFMAADGREVGTIPYGDYNALIQKYQRVVNLPGGGIYGAPPIDGVRWEEWFADEFNKYRALDATSRNEAVESYSAATIEDFEQKLIALTNAERQASGLQGLIADAIAMEFAQIRAQEITIHWGHSRPNGESLVYGGLHFTEIIHKGSSTPQGAINGWMASDGHRAVLLGSHEDYGNRFGVGVNKSESDNNFYWVEVFVLWDPNM